MADYLVFLDECGEHNLEKADPVQPIFCLVAVIVKHDVYKEKVAQLNAIKLKYFKHEGEIIRSYDIRKWQGCYRILKDSTIRSTFYADVMQFLKDGYFFIVCSIDKVAYKVKYHKSVILNPYELSLAIILERLGYFLKKEKINDIHLYAESRGKKEDNSLYAAFGKIMAGSLSSHIVVEDFKGKNIKLEMISKTTNVSWFTVSRFDCLSVHDDA